MHPNPIKYNHISQLYTTSLIATLYSSAYPHEVIRGGREGLFARLSTLNIPKRFVSQTRERFSDASKGADPEEIFHRLQATGFGFSSTTLE